MTELEDFEHHISFLADVVIGGDEIASKLIRGCTMTNDPTEPKKETTAESYPSEFPAVVSILKYAEQAMNGEFNGLMEEFKTERRHRLYTTAQFYASALYTKRNNGTWNYEPLIAYIKFLEELRKDLAAVHQGFELAKRWAIDDATMEERQRIAETDKKYKPQYKVREAAETEAKTKNEKLIQQLMKNFGFSREMAEQAILAPKTPLATEAGETKEG